jgi:hypothetical protein
MKKDRFRIFTRTWWVVNADWPGGREPGAGRKRTIGYAATEREAQIQCNAWNAENKPGKLSRKAEYEGY